MSGQRALLTLGLAIAAAGASGLALHRVTSDPAGAWLRRSGGAEWIQDDAPLVASHHRIGETRIVFRCRFELPEAPEGAVLTIAALRGYGLSVNGVAFAPENDSQWNEPDAIGIAAALRSGPNELRVEVRNDRGPPALLAHSRDLGIATGAAGPAWMTSPDGESWRPARPVSEREPFPISSAFESPARSVWRTLPVLTLLFAIGAAGSFWTALRADHVRWLLLGAWTFLCINNIGKLPLGVGFDVGHHHAYVVYVASTGRIPLASDGWQMFQPPLFYLIAAPVQLALSELWSHPEVFRALRVISMLCGLAQIEIAFRAGRIVFPDRRLPQIAAGVVGGGLPINLYSAQVMSNEPLAGALTALLLLVSLRLLGAESGPALRRAAIGLGALLGLAALAKVTPLLLVPVLVGLLVHLGRARGLGPGPIGAVLAGFATSAAAVGGWYYLRNWILLGRPFVGGWDPERGFGWWQDPGFRTADHFLGFGESLVRPLYASLAGFWDGLYSTLWLDGLLSGVAHARAVPWQIDPMLAMALLSLPMTLALLGGVALACRRAPERKALVFSAACLCTYLAAMAAIFAAVPTYSSVKATYLLGLLPCVGVLVGAAIGRLERHRVSHALVSGYLAAWAGAAWLGYLVTGA